MDNPYSIRVENSPMNRTKKIYLLRRYPGGATFFNLDQNSNLTIATEVRDFQVMEDKPSVILDEDMFDALVSHIFNNFKAPEGKFIEGKLIGTERHLEDLRTLVFGPKSKIKK